MLYTMTNETCYGHIFKWKPFVCDIVCKNSTCLLKILASTDFLSNRFSALCQSNTGLTEHYLAGLEKEKKINSVLPQRQQDENFPQGFPQGIVEGLGKYGLN